ncbi:MAG: hypothetical protein Q9181_008088 [Wetmoreana brouardii]
MAQHPSLPPVTSIWQSLRRKKDKTLRTSNSQLTQEKALRKIMEFDHPVSDPDDPSVKRREYEINLRLLFRLVQTQRFHNEIPEPMKQQATESYKQLLAFVNNKPGKEKRYRESRGRLFSPAKGGFLTELVIYWRDFGEKEEMMRYKDIWEYVARRPLAWERLGEWMPPPKWEIRFL